MRHTIRDDALAHALRAHSDAMLREDYARAENLVETIRALGVRLGFVVVPRPRTGGADA